MFSLSPKLFSVFLKEISLPSAAAAASAGAESQVTASEPCGPACGMKFKKRSPPIYSMQCSNFQIRGHYFQSPFKLIFPIFVRYDKWFARAASLSIHVNN